MDMTFDPQTLADDLYEVRRIYAVSLLPWIKPVGTHRSRAVPRNGPCTRRSPTCAR